MKKKLITYLIISLVSLFLLPFSSALAFGQYFEEPSLKGDLIALSDDQTLQVLIPAGTYNNAMAIYITQNPTAIIPEGLTLLSNIYNLNIVHQENTPKTIKITMTYQGEQDEYTAKSIYQWQAENIWKKLDSFNEVNNKTLAVNLSGDSFTLAVFETRSTALKNENNNYQTPDHDLNIITPIEWQNDFSIIYKSFDHLNYPENLTRISHIYEYDIKKESNLEAQPITLKISYREQGDYAKELYYWDNNQQDWIKMNAVNNFDNQTLTSQTNFTYLRFAVFLRTDSQEGTASWYGYKNCNCAASRDYPKGTKLKVTNLTAGSKNYGKSITVKINDFGPELWTKRLIDLDRKAYQQIASLKSGIMKVRVEKIND